MSTRRRDNITMANGSPDDMAALVAFCHDVGITTFKELLEAVHVPTIDPQEHNDIVAAQYLKGANLDYTIGPCTRVDPLLPS